MADYTTLIITGLLGSSGIVALVATILNHREKMSSLDVEKAKVNKALQSTLKKRIPLEYHPLFTTLDELEFFFMHSFCYPDHGRTLVVRELCVAKVRAWRSVLKEYATRAQDCFEHCEYRAKGQPCNKSKNLMAAMLMEGVTTYSLLYSKDKIGMRDVTGVRLYDQESLDTMNIFIEIFNQWHESRVEMVRVASHEIPASGMNENCHDDYWDVFSVYLYAFVQMKYDAVSAMRKLNGQLTGRKFLGVVIGDAYEKIQ